MLWWFFKYCYYKKKFLDIVVLILLPFSMKIAKKSWTKHFVLSDLYTIQLYLTCYASCVNLALFISKSVGVRAGLSSKYIRFAVEGQTKYLCKIKGQFHWKVKIQWQIFLSRSMFQLYISTSHPVILKAAMKTYGDNTISTNTLLSCSASLSLVCVSWGFWLQYVYKDPFLMHRNPSTPTHERDHGGTW